MLGEAGLEVIDREAPLDGEGDLEATRLFAHDLLRLLSDLFPLRDGAVRDLFFVLRWLGQIGEALAASVDDAGHHLFVEREREGALAEVERERAIGIEAEIGDELIEEIVLRDPAFLRDARERHLGVLGEGA